MAGVHLSILRIPDNAPEPLCSVGFLGFSVFFVFLDFFEQGLPWPTAFQFSSRFIGITTLLPSVAPSLKKASDFMRNPAI